MSKEDKLFEIIDAQQGYFTSRQAVECGYHRQHFHRRVASGEWRREGRGIFRYARYPIGNQEELARWSLWSQSSDGQVLGVWSHETALAIFDLSDNMPSTYHMTLPPHVRKTNRPDHIEFHKGYLHPTEVQEKRGFKVTTPLKTIIDCIKDGRLEDHLLRQALKEALSRGLLSRQEIFDSRKIYPDEYGKTQELLLEIDAQDTNCI